MQRLLTFGCSWTFGVGAAWVPGMNEDDYNNIAWNETNEKYTFRKKLAGQFNLQNTNFAEGGASNEFNFRLARELFTDKAKLAEMKNAIVLWGITSTARNEWFSTEANCYINFKSDKSFNDVQKYFAKFYVKYIYTHHVEVDKLTSMMLMWNDLFEFYGIKNIWFDTFNTHDYTQPVPNLIRPNDLLSIMTPTVQADYHTSSWKDDDMRITQAVKDGLVNPISFHPTAKGHTVIADAIAPYIEKKLNGS